MPRTKQVKNLDEPKDDAADIFKNFKETYLKKRQELVKQKEMTFANFRLQVKQRMLTIKTSVGNKTLKELRENINWQTTTSVKHCSVMQSTIHLGDTGILKKKTSDDGYLTSDSTTDNSGGMRKGRSSRRSRSTTCTSSLRRSSRTSRSISRTMNPAITSTVIKSSRKSRSMSRTTSRNIQNKYKTPINNRKLENFGMVTPKMKPNTPSVVLRRPQQGEIAISLRGSPLMTTAMVSETTANVNIPLADGRMINIQPMKGLRHSEIPDLDPEIQRQLRTLRDNLDKVCQYSNIK